VSPQAFFMALMHLDRNFLRTLPCRPFASACLEHSIDAALRGVAALSSARQLRFPMSGMPDSEQPRTSTCPILPTKMQGPSSRLRHEHANNDIVAQQFRRHAEQSQLPSNGTATPLRSNSYNPQPATSQQPRDGNLQTFVATQGASIVVPCALAFAELLIISS